MKRFLLILSVSVFQLSASPYYIDNDSGIDSNNGTSTATPWKRHPYMTGWSGSYSHTTGDRFIFKGGVVWTNGCFPINVTAGGTGANPDYYGVDTSWFTGGSFTMPVFDAQDARITTTFNRFINLDNSGVNNTQWDRLVFYRFYTDVTDGGNWYLVYIGESTSMSNNVFMNCTFTNWTHASYASGARDGGGACLMQHGNNSSANVMTNCLVDGRPGNGTNSNAATRIVGHLYNNVIRHISNGLLPGDANSQIISNTIGPIWDCFDADSHENNLETLGSGSVRIDGNIMFSPTAVLFLSSSEAADYTIINNLAISTNSVIPWQIHDHTRTDVDVFFANNTTVSDTAEFRNQGDLRTVGVFNNHFITDYSDPYYWVGGSATTHRSYNNLTQTLAQARSGGFTEANGWSPTNSTVATVNLGTNLSATFTTSLNGITRPSSNSFDIGAYEFDQGGGGGGGYGPLTLINATAINVGTLILR